MAARPWPTPRWNPASRSRAAVADLGVAGAAGEPLIAPGTRFARGTRTGRPAVVTPPEDGAMTVLAACQPPSAGGTRLPSTAAVPPDCLRLFPNQSDSTASYMGRRPFSAGPPSGPGAPSTPAGGTQRAPGP